MFLFSTTISWDAAQDSGEHWAPICHRTVTSTASSLITCTLLTDDHTEIDGRPVRIWGSAVGAAPVGLVEPDLLGYFIIRESFRDRLLHRFNPLLFLLYGLGYEAATTNVPALSICLVKAN